MPVHTCIHIHAHTYTDPCMHTCTLVPIEIIVNSSGIRVVHLKITVLVLRTDPAVRSTSI